MSPSTPSIKTNGEALEPDPKVPVPRMLKFMVDSSDPPLLLTDMFKPGIWPCRACDTLDTGREANTSESTIETAPVKLTFFCVP